MYVHMYSGGHKNTDEYRIFIGSLSSYMNLCSSLDHY